MANLRGQPGGRLLQLILFLQNDEAPWGGKGLWHFGYEIYFYNIIYLLISIKIHKVVVI